MLLIYHHPSVNLSQVSHGIPDNTLPTAATLLPSLHYLFMVVKESREKLNKLQCLEVDDTLNYKFTLIKYFKSSSISYLTIYNVHNKLSSKFVKTVFPTINNILIQWFYKVGFTVFKCLRVMEQKTKQVVWASVSLQPCTPHLLVFYLCSSTILNFH